MVDLMMWLVIAAMLLAAALQGIGYYQKAANVYTLKSDLTGASEMVMASASRNNGVIDLETVQDALKDVKTSSGVVLIPEASTNGGLPIIRATHLGVDDKDGVYLFKECLPYIVGVNMVPKEGSALTESCGIAAAPDSDGDGTPDSSDADVDGDGTPNDSDPDIDGDGTPNETDSTPSGEGSTPTPKDTDSDGIPDTSDPDIDGDGIDNAADTDADGNGVRDDYVPGGNITEADGTAYAYSGNFVRSWVSNGGRSIWATFKTDATPEVRRVAAHFVAICVRPDGTEYDVNGLNGFNSATSTTVTTSIEFANCGANRVYSYSIKPVTTEAMASGKISNPTYFGNYTFSGGYRWSEPDGFILSGDLTSALVGNGGNSLYTSSTYDNAPEVRRIASQYELTCERADKTVYTKNVLNGSNSVANTTGTFTATTSCDATAHRIVSYKIYPVAKLGLAANPDFFGGFTMRGSRSWSEETDGYPTSGEFVSASTNGPSIFAVYKQDSSPEVRRLAIQYEATCVRTDKTSYTVNSLFGANSVANSTANFAFTISACGTSLIRDYKLYPVNDLGASSNPTFFGGYTMRGTYNWSEAIDGYPTGGTIESVIPNAAKTSMAVAMKVGEGHGVKRFAIQYKLTCLNASAVEYKVNALSIFNSTNPSQGNYSATLSCGGNRIISSEVSPVNDLRSVSDPTGFGGWTLKNTHNWAG
jgi:hypothetical protein